MEFALAFTGSFAPANERFKILYYWRRLAESLRQ
jgi:hypothetical protein